MERLVHQTKPFYSMGVEAPLEAGHLIIVEYGNSVWQLTGDYMATIWDKYGFRVKKIYDEIHRSVRATWIHNLPLGPISQSLTPDGMGIHITPNNSDLIKY